MLLPVLGVIFALRYAVPQTHNRTQDNGLIQVNPGGQSTEQVAVINHRIVSLNATGAEHTSAKEKVKNEHVIPNTIELELQKQKILFLVLFAALNGL